MPADGKGMLAILLSKQKGKPSAEPEASEPDSDDAGADSSDLESIGQELIDAVKAGDAKGVAESLRAAHSVCAGE